MNKDTISHMYVQLKPLARLQQTELPFFGVRGLWMLSAKTKPESLVKLCKELDAVIHSASQLRLYQIPDYRGCLYIPFPIYHSVSLGPKNAPASSLFCKRAAAQLWILGFAGRLSSLGTPSWFLPTASLHFSLPWTHITGPVWHLTTAIFCVDPSRLPPSQDVLLSDVLLWSKRTAHRHGRRNAESGLELCYLIQ